MKFRYLLFFFLLSTVTARAAEEPITMVVSSPFAVTEKPLSVVSKFGRWFPVAVTLSNTGDPVSGEVSLRFLTRNDDNGPQNAPTMTTVANVDLPTRSNKRVWLYARRDGDQWDNARVVFRAARAKTLVADFDLNAVDQGKRIIWAVSDAGEPYKWLGGFSQRALESIKPVAGVPQASNASRPLKPIAAKREMVPDRWAGLESADAVVLHDFSHSALAPAQIDALRGYVATGGTLIVTGGANWQRLASSPLASLWPVVPTGSSAATAGETRALVQRYVKSPTDGADRLGGSPAVLTRGTLKSDTVLLTGSASQPLSAVRSTGAGRVVWLAFDPSQPPFIGWRGQEKLWLELTKRMVEPVRFEGADPERRLQFGAYEPQYREYGEQQNKGATSTILQVIKKLPQLQMPATSVIAWFLAGYVFLLVPVNYFVLRAFDRREWAWFSVPLIAVAFSFASYQAARRIKGTDLLRRHVSVVQGAQGLARTDAMLWVRSPRRAYYSVSSPNASMVLSDYQVFGEDERPQETRVRIDELTRSLRAEDVSVPMWTEAQFTGEGTLDVKGGLSVNATDSSSSKARALSIVNKTPYVLSNGVVINNGQVWRCKGALKANGSAPLKLDLAHSSSAERATIDGVKAASRATDRTQQVVNSSEVAGLFATTNGLAASDKTLAELAQAVLRQVLARRPNGPVFIGWSRDAVSPLTLEGEAPVTQNVSLFVLRLPANSPLS